MRAPTVAALAGAGAALALAAAPLSAATTAVDCAPPTSANLQTAIDAAAPGDTLLINGTCSAALVPKTLTIAGDPNATSPPVINSPVGLNATVAPATVRLESLTVTGAIDGFVAVFAGGAGITMQLSQVTVTGNASAGVAGFGGAALDISGSTISGNGIPPATVLAGGVLATGPLSISASTISGNVGGTSVGIFGPTGGGISAAGGPGMSVTSSFIENNRSTGDGGGVRTVVPASFVSAMIQGNRAGGRGGGIFAGLSGTQRLSVRTSFVRRNRAANGGGIYRTGGLFTNQVSFITGNVPNNIVLGP